MMAHVVVLVITLPGSIVGLTSMGNFTIVDLNEEDIRIIYPKKCLPKLKSIIFCYITFQLGMTIFSIQFFN